MVRNLALQLVCGLWVVCAILISPCSAVQAQNSAESPVKPKSQPAEKESPSAKPEKNVAESGAKKSGAESSGKSETDSKEEPKKDDQPQPQPQPEGSGDSPDDPKPVPEGTETAGEDSEKDSGDADSGAGDNGSGTESGQESPVPEDGAGSDAESTLKESTEPAGDAGPMPESDSPAVTEPGSVAEKPAVPGDDEASPIPPPVQPQQPANAAESRPAGSAPANTAESGDGGEGESEIAEPPEPWFSLPHPDTIAGSAEDYQAPTGPELQFSDVEEFPSAPSLDEFYNPLRAYLENRPLPDIDVEETDEETIARNIEESLKLIDLEAESRPEGGIKIPLPSGQMTFKASDAFEFDRHNRILKFIGNAEIVFDTIAIWADLIEVDDGAAVAYAKGYVAVQEKDEILFCDEAYINYDTKTLELFWVEGNTGGPRLEGSLFFEADRAYGSFDELIMEKVKLTTCEPFCGGPTEFHMTAEKAKYKRGKSVTMYNAYFYARESKYMYVPMLAFPLTREQRYAQEESDIQQTYGFSRTEGWFAKFAYTYSRKYVDGASGPLIGAAKLDISERQGPGLGLRQDFWIPSLGVTTVRGFYQRSWPDLPLRRFYFHPFGSPPDIGILSDEQYKSASDGVNVNFDFSMDQELNFNRYLTGNFKITRTDKITPARTINGQDRRNNSWRNSLLLNYNKAGTRSSLSANQTINITGGFTRDDGTQEPSRESNNTTGAIRYDRNLTKELKFGLSQDYSSGKGGSTTSNLPADQEGTFRMNLDWQGKRESELEGYTARLQYLEQGIDYDQDANTRDNNKQLRKELPSLEVNLPRDVFNDGAYFNNFKIKVENLVTGRRRTPESSLKAQLDVGGQDNIKFSNSSNLDTRVTFQQYWYDDYNAQFVVRPSLNYRYQPGGWWQFSSNWSMTYRQGVLEPPVQGDRQVYRNNIGFSWIGSNKRSWRWTLRSGYDFRDHSPNPISSQFNWDPNRTFGVTQTMQYDLRRKQFNPTAMSGYFRSPYVDDYGYYNWVLKFTWNHDLENHFRTTRYDLRWLKRWGNGWTSDVVGSYRTNSDFAPNFSSPEDTWEFSRDFVKKIGIRKTNCCTTIEGIWRIGINAFEVNFYLNALPQYPLDVQTVNADNSNAEQNLYFPGESLRQDILNDMFGITQRIF